MSPHPPALPPEAGSGSPVQLVVGLVLVLFVLWVAYRIGKVILRVVAGLLFLGLAGYGIWYLFLR
ncbi:hypothetical protein [Mesoterricola sediminis]|uniref:Uncharacterized protein n=1 Tax=Mesoterricola sediminis TaxID=2927980 RepID=A0AA48GVS7_9BACT|nr:hypothetical protein [Mesoterricola sediminis]BDU76555.1 hypothetical protein METESE_15130 [Mesoterricola sediminis]